MKQIKVVTVVGTRPEGIKMAPVVLALRRHREMFRHTFVSTAQQFSSSNGYPYIYENLFH